MAALELSPMAGDEKHEQNLQDASRSRINHYPNEGSSRIRPLETIPPMRSVRGSDGTDLLSAAATLFDPAVYHIADSVATQITNGLGVHIININDSVDPQGNDDGDVWINTDPPTEHVNMPTAVSIQRLGHAFIGGSVLTIGMDIAAALYKPARGVVFGRNTTMYYLILAGIFLWGVANAFTGIWLSRSRQISNCRLSIAKIVLALTLIPFCAILGIGGFAFTQS